jgi:non-specific serine/threonine protein kinase
MGLVSLFLQAQPTPLLGRAGELEMIHQRLVTDGARLLTLTGPAGVGKTRLALAAAQVAEQVSDRFPDGVVVVDLTPVRDPHQVLAAIAHACGFRDTGSPPLSERLPIFLRERALLLVLDNFEQVLPAAATLAELLSTCPRLALLVTSRVPLRLRWERTLRVPPLPVPNLDAALPPLDELGHIPSVALFVERARAHRADFALTEARAPLVAQLAVQLDGLPLALELAAARLGALPLAVIAHRLEDRLRLWRWEAPDRPERQHSLAAALDWSYDLLSEPERRLFRHLGVFVGRVALSAVAAVVAAGTAGAGNGERRADEGTAGEEGPTLVELVSLAEKSLVLPAEQTSEEDEASQDSEPAFGMLETVREYAQDQLAARGELEAARRAHAHYFLALAEQADPLLRGRDQRAWFFRLEREHDNLRAALRWLLDQDDPAERTAGLRLAGALGWFWLERGYQVEGWRWLEEALRRAPEADAAVHTRALLGAGRILTEQGELDRATALLEAALAEARQWQDAAALAQALIQLGYRAVMAGDWAESTRVLQEALRRCQELGDPHAIAFTLLWLTQAAFAQGDVAEAVRLASDALALFEALGDARLAGPLHFGLGVFFGTQGDLPHAGHHVRAGLEASVALQDRWLLGAGARTALALQGERADSAQHARLLGAADALGQATSATFLWERLPTYPSMAGLRQRLEEEGWATAYREGRSLPFAEVAALALTMVEDFARTPATPDLPETRPETAQLQQERQVPQTPFDGHASLLSARELEVLRLVAQGLTNKAIGNQLFISASTVNYHLTSTFNKLAVETRAQAVAVAAQRGLL